MTTVIKPRIAKAAIIHKGKIYTGWRHCVIGHEMLKAGACKRPFPGGNSQGFVLEDGSFVGREEAMRIAREAGQGKIPDRRLELFSEWMWDKNGLEW